VPAPAVPAAMPAPAVPAPTMMPPTAPLSFNDTGRRL
jgi:hypothetical protein